MELLHKARSNRVEMDVGDEFLEINVLLAYD
jgi:hypothetical protein